MGGESGVVQLALESGGYTYGPVVVWDDRDVLLFDAGLPGMAGLIREQMEAAGAPFARLNKVLITHQDEDHIGSLAELVSAAQQPIEVMAHELAQPYLQGEKPLIKSGALASNPVRVDVLITDGEELPYCGGLIAIHTPGHSPDHLSFYHKPSKTLIAGDATAADQGRILGPNPLYTPDLQTARNSLRKMAAFEVETVLCYHGGKCSGEALRQYMAAL